MERVFHNKSFLHRFIAVVMAVVMVLTLVAIDSHVHLFAEEDIKTIDITDLLKGDDENAVSGFSALTKFKLKSDKVDGIDLAKVMYKEYTGEPSEILGTPTDVTKYNKIGAEEELAHKDKNLKYAFYYPTYNDKDELQGYQLIGTIRVSYDDKQPEIGSAFDLVAGNDRLIEKDGYYILNLVKEGEAAVTPKFEIKAKDTDDENATGIDKVVWIKNGDAKETEIEKIDGKYIFSVPDASGEYTFKAYDKAGNASGLSQPLIIKKLNGIPSITKVTTTAVKKTVNDLTFLVSANTVKVTVNVARSTAGDGGTAVDVGAKLCYKFIAGGKESAEITKDIIGNAVDFEIPASALDKDKRTLHTVAICVEDEFGNRTYSTDLDGNILFVSDQKPVIEINDAELIRGKGYDAYPEDTSNKWAQSMTLGLDVSDDYSYIDSIYYSYTGKSGSGIPSSGNIVIEKNLFDFRNATGLNIVGTGKADGSADKIELADGQYTLTFKAKNYVGKEGTKSIDVYIDNTAPTLNMTSDYAQISVGKEKYYPFSTTKQCMNITWGDAGGSGVDERTVTAKLVRTGKEGRDQNLNVAIDGEGKAHVSIDSKTQSGRYTLEVEVYDHAGNKQTAKQPVFVNRSDVTAEISATAGGDDIKSGSYITADRIVVTGTAKGYSLTADDLDISLNDADIKASSDCKITSTAGELNTITFTYVISVSKASKLGNYVFKLTAHNHGTDETKTAKYSLVYDTACPTVTVDKVAVYNRSSVTLNWAATDNEYVKTVVIEGTRTECMYDAGKIDREEYDVNVRLKGTTTSYVFKEDGRYSLGIYALDAAGNRSVVKMVSFIIDREKPQAEYDELKTDPSVIDNKSQTIDITVHDSYGIDGDDVTATIYYRTYNGTKGTKIATFDRVSNEIVKASVNLRQVGGKAAVYRVEVSGNDKAGNAVVDADGLAGNRYYIDNTKPTISISPKPEKTNGGYYKGEVAFDVNIGEQFNRKHTLTITDANGTIQEKNTAFEFNEYVYGASYTGQGEYNLTIKVTDAAGNVSTVGTKFVIDKTKPVVQLGDVALLNTGNVTLPITLTDNMKGSKYTVHVVRTDANGNKAFDADLEKGTWNGTDFSKNYTFADEGDYTVTVLAEDKAGNRSDVKTAKFRIDKTAPVISISGVGDRQTTSATATISVDEAFSFDYEGRSLGASDIRVSITKKTDGTGASNMAELTTGSFSGGNPHTATYNFTDDGEYTITVNARDLAGNVAASATKTFKIDSKAPVIKMSVTDKNSKTVKSYDAVGSTDMLDPNYVDMALSVEETFFRTNNVKITVKKDGKDISSSSFANYSNSSAVSTGSQRFEEDGVYDVSITAQDELGNKAEDYNIVFTVDNTAPTVESTEKLLSFMAKSTAEADGSLLLNADDFADILNSGYDALWKVNDTSVFDVDVKMDGVDFIDFSDMSDGYHKITLSAIDEVGHKTSQEFEFTYDGTAPRIIITGVEDGETVREPFDMTIGLENEEDEIISIVINGNTIDPAQYKSNNQYKMHVEEYDTYTIEVTATDKAGNISSTVDEKTGAVFTFRLSEGLSPVALVLIIIAAILLVALLIFVIIAGKKRKKKNAA